MPLQLLLLTMLPVNYLPPAAVTLIEWPDRLPLELLPRRRLEIHIGIPLADQKSLRNLLSGEFDPGALAEACRSRGQLLLKEDLRGDAKSGGGEGEGTVVGPGWGQQDTVLLGTGLGQQDKEVRVLTENGKCSWAEFIAPCAPVAVTSQQARHKSTEDGVMVSTEPGGPSCIDEGDGVRLLRIEWYS